MTSTDASIDANATHPANGKKCDICGGSHQQKGASYLSRPTCCTSVVYVCEKCRHAVFYGYSLSRDPKIIEIYRTKCSTCPRHCTASVAEVEFLYAE